MLEVIRLEIAHSYPDEIFGSIHKVINIKSLMEEDIRELYHNDHFVPCTDEDSSECFKIEDNSILYKCPECDGSCQGRGEWIVVNTYTENTPINKAKLDKQHPDIHWD
jgi:hypothetical protein